MQTVDPDIALTEDRQGAESGFNGDEKRKQQGSPHQLASLAVMTPYISGRRDDRENDDNGADAMREMDRDLRVPVVGDKMSEHQREIGDGEPRIRMPHRCADENLREDQDSRGGGEATDIRTRN